MIDLAPFSPACHTARADARQRRIEVHQRLGVLTPDPAWWVECEAQTQAAVEIITASHGPLLRADGQPTFGQRIGERRRQREEERRANAAD